MVKKINRRNFINLVGTGAAGMTLIGNEFLHNSAVRNPNILWITCEDISPDLGCYGNREVGTPNLDRLAGEGVRYTNACTTYGVCAPSRSTIITGMYPTSIGSMHMRTRDKGYETVPPAYVKCFTEYLRAAGYFCTNHTKTDYQFECPITAWDRRKGDWRDPTRKKDQPFFSVINLIITHESQIWTPPDKKPIHDPSKVTLPPYYPDTPIVRNDYARYYDNITTMDGQAGEILKRLEEDGLAENTVVFFYGDHGRGLPRAKRWCYDSSILVPLIIRWPGKIPAGIKNDQLVSFVDLAPTVLSIAGIEIPSYMQGGAFLGENKGEPRRYVFAARDRMDEADDMIRAVRDKRYKYIRNFKPELPYAQHIAYMDKMPTMQEWRRLNKENKLVGPQKLFFSQTKPVEELYDIVSDPHEIDNLADSPAHKDILIQMRKVIEEWMAKTHDLGLIPEEELKNRMWPGGSQPETVQPIIIPDGGKFDHPVSVSISCPTEGASVAYTFDEGEDAHWNLYSKKIEMRKRATLRVRAIRIGYKESGEIRKEFIIGK